MDLKRAVTLTAGKAMVVTDLHGNGEVYDALRDHFLAEQQAGRLQHLVICGDLIHGSGPIQEDESLRMLLDVMRLQDEMGKDTVMLLCGNHEMPHIYGMTLSRGYIEYTPRFEAALAAMDDPDYSREDVVNFLADLPFYVFTAAGVMLSHAGPAETLTTPEAAERILNFDHRAFLAHIDAQLVQYDLAHARDLYAERAGDRYENLARRYLAVESADDPRYNHLLRSFVWSGEPDFELLWDALFTRNEQDFPNDMRRVIEYGDRVQQFLAAMSQHNPPYPQHVVVSGHIMVQGGYEVVDDYHLRLATYEHARPNTDGQFLVLDCEASIPDADALVPHLHATSSAER